jgi:integrase
MCAIQLGSKLPRFSLRSVKTKILTKFGAECRLYNYKLSIITKEMIQTLHSKVSKNGIYAANGLIRVLSAIFNKGVEWDLLGVNPCAKVQKHKEKSRDRFLSKEEMPLFFKALEEDPNEQIKDFIKLCLYTGARQ